MKVAKVATSALASVHQNKYKFGVSRDLVYPAHGTSADWAHEKLGIKYTYILELKPTLKPEEGYLGFLLPVDEIKPTLEETWAGLVGMTTAILANSSNSSNFSLGVLVFNSVVGVWNSFISNVW